MPFLAGTLDLARERVIPGGTRSNHRFLADKVDWGELPEAEQLALADAQTSGGLLVAVSEGRAAAFRGELERRGVAAAEIGRTAPGPPERIAVRGRIVGGA